MHTLFWNGNCLQIFSIHLNSCAREIFIYFKSINSANYCLLFYKPNTWRFKLFIFVSIICLTSYLCSYIQFIPFYLAKLFVSKSRLPQGGDHLLLKFKRACVNLWLCFFFFFCLAIIYEKFPLEKTHFQQSNKKHIQFTRNKMMAHNEPRSIWFWG